MEQHANRTVFLGWMDGRIARLAAVTVTKILSAILTLGIFGWVSTAHAVIPASQRAVLIDIYTSTNGASWTNNTNWNGAMGTECTWFGVVCDSSQSNVTSVSLGGNNLVGTLPSLTGLSALVAFYVFDNKLTGSIPPLSGLTALLDFRVLNNQLTGPVPAAPPSLVAGLSKLCGNSLVSSGNSVTDSAWVTAAGNLLQTGPA